MSEWTVPGYVVEELIGRGATASVWRGRDLDSGRAVALKRIAKSAAKPSGERIRAEIAAQTGARGPGALPVLDVLTLDNSVIVVSPLAAITLRSLVADRGRLTPGEVVAIVSSVGSALTRAHAAGIAHGDVAPANVLFDHTGTPLLGDFGQARCLMQTDAQSVVSATPNVADPRLFDGVTPDAAADVFGLAAVAYFGLGGRPLWIGEGDAGVAAAARSGLRPALARLAPSAPTALLAAIESGLNPNAASRPSVAQLVTAIRAACPPMPVMISSAGVGPEPQLAGSETQQLGTRRHAHRVAEPPPDQPPGHRRWLLLATVSVAVALIVSVAGGLAWGHHDDGATAKLRPISMLAHAANSSGFQTDWLALTRQLAATRTQAIVTGDVSLLDQVYVPGSQPEHADTRTINRLQTGGFKAKALKTVIRSASLLTSRPSKVTLRVTMTTSAWRIVDPTTSSTVALAPGLDQATVKMVLVATPDGWRIASL